MRLFNRVDQSCFEPIKDEHNLLVTIFISNSSILTLKRQLSSERMSKGC